MVAGGRAGGEPTGSFLPKLGGRGRGGRRGAFYKTRASGLETSVSLQISEETFASPRRPKSHGGWGRAGVGLETSNAFSRALGDLVLTQASGALPLLVPAVRSVRSSHRQLTSQFPSLTPAARGSGGLGRDQRRLPLHPPSSDLHEDNLLWVRGGGSQSPGQVA